jgi:hypothetical protein
MFTHPANLPGRHTHHQSVGLHVFVHYCAGTYKCIFTYGDATYNGAVRAKGCALFHQGIAVFVLAFNQ